MRRVEYWNNTPVVFKNREASFSVSDAHFTLCLQPSGAVLVELRGEDEFLSSYLDNVVDNRFVSNRMYGKNARYYVTKRTIVLMELVANLLRDTNSWDAKYAPGPDFTGE